MGLDLYSLVDEDQQGNFPSLEGGLQGGERLPITKGNRQ